MSYRKRTSSIFEFFDKLAIFVGGISAITMALEFLYALAVGGLSQLDCPIPVYLAITAGLGLLTIFGIKDWDKRTSHED